MEVHVYELRFYTSTKIETPWLLFEIEFGKQKLQTVELEFGKQKLQTVELE